MQLLKDIRTIPFTQQLNTSHYYYLSMLTVEEIVKKLADRNLSEVARRTELSLPTVWRIANNQAGNVGYETVKTLSDYLEAQA
jgi:DNA invertase Pin-like site-specific DNA recombinase